MPRNNLNPQPQSSKPTSPATPSTKAAKPICDKKDMCPSCHLGPDGDNTCSGWPTEVITKGPYRCVQFDAQSENELGSHTFFPISPNSYIIIYDETNKPVYRLKPFPIPTDGNQYVE